MISGVSQYTLTSLKRLYSHSELDEILNSLIFLCSPNISNLEINEINYLIFSTISLSKSETSASFDSGSPLNLIAKLFLKEENLPGATISVIIDKLLLGVYGADGEYFQEVGQWPTLRYATALLHPNTSKDVIAREISLMLRSSNKLILRNWETTALNQSLQLGNLSGDYLAELSQFDLEPIRSSAMMNKCTRTEDKVIASLLGSRRLERPWRITQWPARQASAQAGESSGLFIYD